MISLTSHSQVLLEKVERACKSSICRCNCVHPSYVLFTCFSCSNLALFVCKVSIMLAHVSIIAKCSNCSTRILTVVMISCKASHSSKSAVSKLICFAASKLSSFSHSSAISALCSARISRCNILAISFLFVCLFKEATVKRQNQPSLHQLRKLS